MKVFQKLTTPRRVWPFWIGLLVFWGSYYYRTEVYLTASSLYVESNSSSTSDGMLLIAASFKYVIGFPFWLFVAGLSFGHYQGAQPLFGKIKAESFWGHTVNFLCFPCALLALILCFSSLKHLYEVITRIEMHSYIPHALLGVTASTFWVYLWLSIRVMNVNRINLHNAQKHAKRPQ